MGCSVRPPRLLVFGMSASRRMSIPRSIQSGTNAHSPAGGSLGGVSSDAVAGDRGTRGGVALAVQMSGLVLSWLPRATRPSAAKHSEIMIALLGDDVPRSARALGLRQSWKGWAASRKHLYIPLQKKKKNYATYLLFNNMRDNSNTQHRASSLRLQQS